VQIYTYNIKIKETKKIKEKIKETKKK